MDEVGAPDPVTRRVPTPYESTGAARRAAIAYSSRSLVTVIRVLGLPSLSSSARTDAAWVTRSPESRRTPPRSGPAMSTARRTARSTSYVSTSSVVDTPRASSWARNACSSESCSRVKECAAVPTVRTP